MNFGLGGGPALNRISPLQGGGGAMPIPLTLNAQAITLNSQPITKAA